MALLKIKDAVKMNKKERIEKLRDLQMELSKANVTANKTNAKTKELKRAIARLYTIMKSEKNSANPKEGLSKA